MDYRENQDTSISINSRDLFLNAIYVDSSYFIMYGLSTFILFKFTLNPSCFIVTTPGIFIMVCNCLDISLQPWAKPALKLWVHA